MYRLASLDPRAVMALVGGVLGLAVVTAVFALRGPSVYPGTGYPYDVPSSVGPPPFEPLGPDGLSDAFDNLGRVTVAGRPATLSIARAEDLVLPSGRMIAADAYALDGVPLSVTLPSGRYQVVLLQVSGEYGPSIAAAKVRFEDGAPARWEAGPVYSVDSSTASFASPEAIAAFKALPRKQADAMTQRLLDEYDAAGGYALTAAMTVDPSSGANVVTFLSGLGDGAYRTWVGYDAAGTIVALLTSFDLVDDPARPIGGHASTAPIRSP
jgi:hypothetical protein